MSEMEASDDSWSARVTLTGVPEDLSRSHAQKWEQMVSVFGFIPQRTGPERNQDYSRFKVPRPR